MRSAVLRALSHGGEGWLWGHPSYQLTDGLFPCPVSPLPIEFAGRGHSVGWEGLWGGGTKGALGGPWGYRG